MAESQAILSSRSVVERLNILTKVLETEVYIVGRQKEIAKEVENRMKAEDGEKDLLREQLKRVLKERADMGDRDEKEEVIQKFRARMVGEVMLPITYFYTVII